MSKIGKNLEKTSKCKRKHPKRLYEPKIQQMGNEPKSSMEWAQNPKITQKWKKSKIGKNLEKTSEYNKKRPKRLYETKINPRNLKILKIRKIPKISKISQKLEKTLLIFD